MDGIWKACPEAGGPVQFQGFSGKFSVMLKHLIPNLCTIPSHIGSYAAGELICPSYHELCNSVPVSVNGQCPDRCSFNGDCINGRCHCFLGFHGENCSKSELTRFSTLIIFILFMVS